MYKIILGVLALVVLGVSYYGISPLFKQVRIDEDPPLSKEVMVDTQRDEMPTEQLSMIEKNEDMQIASEIKAVFEEGVQPTPGVVKAEMKIEAEVMGTPGHPGSGTARIIDTENGAVVRYENFKTINGPDLYVYLAKDLDAKDFVNLGTLKATEGNINYDVPKDVDVREYAYVMVWCKQFGVLFNYAKIL